MRDVDAPCRRKFSESLAKRDKTRQRDVEKIKERATSRLCRRAAGRGGKCQSPGLGMRVAPQRRVGSPTER